MHEDLANLFSRNLSLHHNPYQPPQQPESPTPVEQPIIYSITQHYHHSAHVAPQQPARSSSEPSQTQQETAESVLAQQGIDIRTLLPTQVELFKHADVPQQLRLIELWRISPPAYTGHALAQELGAWPTTSFEHEEAMAKLRYEHAQLEGRRQQILQSNDAMETSGTLTPIQSSDGRWLESEPYMASGYEALAAREYALSAAQPAKDVYSHFGAAVGGKSYVPAIDPVYKSVDQQPFPNAEERDRQQKLQMANQYGAFTQDRWYGAMAGVAVGDRDEEML
jgi:hypothetical protein